jgi:hypothetical protein
MYNMKQKQKKKSIVFQSYGLVPYQYSMRTSWAPLVYEYSNTIAMIQSSKFFEKRNPEIYFCI